MKYIVDIHGEIEGDYEIIGKYEERPQGKWIEKVETLQMGYGWLTLHEVVCSVCGGSGEDDENIPQNWNYCPNCGADMRTIEKPDDVI